MTVVRNFCPLAGNKSRYGGIPPDSLETHLHLPKRGEPDAANVQASPRQ
jgi:hypothetical protein